jgi:hypothetical protein
MRELILKRIEEFRTKGEFKKSNMRWRNYNVDAHTHISEFDFSACSDEMLLHLYERIIRQLSKVM